MVHATLAAYALPASCAVCSRALPEWYAWSCVRIIPETLFLFTSPSGARIVVSFFADASERDITESAAGLILMRGLREGAAFSVPPCDCEEAAGLSLALGSGEDCYAELAGTLLPRGAVLGAGQVHDSYSYRGCGQRCASVVRSALVV